MELKDAMETVVTGLNTDELKPHVSKHSTNFQNSVDYDLNNSMDYNRGVGTVTHKNIVELKHNDSETIATVTSRRNLKNDKNVEFSEMSVTQTLPFNILNYVTIFDDAAREVLNVLKADSYRRFCQTAEYLDYHCNLYGGPN